MTWQAHITTDPEVLAGKRVVSGICRANGFLLGRLAAGWTQKQILAGYPQLTAKVLRAVFLYAADVTWGEAPRNAV